MSRARRVAVFVLMLLHLDVHILDVASMTGTSVSRSRAARAAGLRQWGTHAKSQQVAPYGCIIIWGVATETLLARLSQASGLPKADATLSKGNVDRVC